MTMMSQFWTWHHHQFFCFVSLIKFRYWSKFHINIIISSGVITIFFYKRLTWNPEIGSTPIRVLPNIWRLGAVRDSQFDRNVSNKMLLNDAECQGYNFYHFWVSKRKPTREVQNYLAPTHIRVKTLVFLVAKKFWLKTLRSTFEQNRNKILIIT